jgi:hypothetical protein
MSIPLNGSHFRREVEGKGMEGSLTKGSFCPWLPKAIESAVVSVVVAEN